MKFEIGDKVVFQNAEKHKEIPRWFPAVGTVGTITSFGSMDHRGENIMVQWPVKSTSSNDQWYCAEDDLIAFKEKEGE